MEDITHSEENVPSQFKEVTTAFCSFYKVLSPLEIKVNADRIVKCVILVTKTNDVIDIENGEVKRVQKLEAKNISKVVVHHHYDPFRRYVVILTATKTAHLLDYDTLKSINSWNDVDDVSSEDITDKGRPELILYMISGDLYSVSEGEFLIENGSCDVGKGRSDAVTALNNKVKSCVWLAESLEAEKRLKERFICQKVSDIANQLKRDECSTLATGSSKVANPACGFFPASSKASTSSLRRSLQELRKTQDGVEPLKVLDSRQRIVHGKWVICIPVINQSERYVLRNLDLILHPCEGIKSLHFTTRLMKTFRRTVKKPPFPAQESDVIIEDLDPPVLKPKKKAFLIALCEFPAFSVSETVSCTGIISFEARKLNPGNESSAKLLQLCFPRVQLSARNLNSLCVDITREQGHGGLSFDLFALVSASLCYKIEINSLASPLHQFIEALSKDHRIIKIPDFSDFYCFTTTGCDPLHLSAFVCKLDSAHKILLTIYVRDDNQGMLLAHNLKPLLPMDAYISEEERKSKLSATPTKDSLYGDLLPKMKLTISKVKDAFQFGERHQELKKSKTDAGSSTNGSNELPNVTGSAKEISLEWEEEKYTKWRQELHCLSLEMESLFAHRI